MDSEYEEFRGLMREAQYEEGFALCGVDLKRFGTTLVGIYMDLSTSINVFSWGMDLSISISYPGRRQS